MTRTKQTLAKKKNKQKQTQIKKKNSIDIKTEKNENQSILQYFSIYIYFFSNSQVQEKNN